VAQEVVVQALVDVVGHELKALVDVVAQATVHSASHRIASRMV
jgi:hypothetical protein